MCCMAIYSEDPEWTNSHYLSPHTYTPSHIPHSRGRVPYTLRWGTVVRASRAMRGLQLQRLQSQISHTRYRLLCTVQESTGTMFRLNRHTAASCGDWCSRARPIHFERRPARVKSCCLQTGTAWPRERERERHRPRIGGPRGRRLQVLEVGEHRRTLEHLEAITPVHLACSVGSGAWCLSRP